MKRNSFTIALMNIFAFGAACGSSAINGIAGTTEDMASSSAAAGESGVRSRPCLRSNTSPAPADGLIADFTNANGGGIRIPGVIVTYAAPKVAGLGAATYTTSEGALNVKVKAAPTSTPQFLGVVVAFNNCIDASGFSGVQFTISGSLSGCTMQYATGDVEHQDMTFAAPFATGAVGPTRRRTGSPSMNCNPFRGPSGPRSSPPTFAATLPRLSIQAS